MTGIVPDDPDVLLRRRQTADALTEAGYPTASSTLSTKATRGGGPPYRLFGRVPLYRWGDALAWAEGRMSPPRRSTSEGDPKPPARVAGSDRRKVTRSGRCAGASESAPALE